MILIATLVVIALATLNCTYTIPKEREITPAERNVEFRSRMRQWPREEKLKFLLGRWNVFISAWSTEGFDATKRKVRIPPPVENENRVLILNVDGTWALITDRDSIFGEWRYEEAGLSHDFQLILTRTPKIPTIDDAIVFEGWFGEVGVLLSRRTSTGHGANGVDWELKRE